MYDPPICPECGSDHMIKSGMFTHGTWVYALTCWTCGNCRAVVAVAGVSEAAAG